MSKADDIRVASQQQHEEVLDNILRILGGPGSGPHGVYHNGQHVSTEPNAKAAIAKAKEIVKEKGGKATVKDAMGMHVKSVVPIVRGSSPTYNGMPGLKRIKS